MPKFQIHEISEAPSGCGSSSVFHVFGRDLAGAVHHVEVTDVPSFITLGIPRLAAAMTDFDASQMADSLNIALLRAVRTERECRRSKCACRRAAKDPDPADAWVSINTMPCLDLRQCDAIACVGAKVVYGKSVLGYYPEAHQFVEFELTRNYYVQPAKRLLYKLIEERQWAAVPECEVYNAHTDATMQFMCNSVRLNPDVTVGGGRWLEYYDGDASPAQIPFQRVRLVDVTANAPLVALAFDLETDFVDGSSVPWKNPIVSISICCAIPGGTSDRELALTWVKGDVAAAKDGNYELARYETEADMLRGFEYWVHAFDPDVISGYNSDGFDWPYLLDRARHLGVPLRLGRLPHDPMPTFMFTKHTVTNQNGTKKKGVFYLPGRVALDALPVVEDRCRHFTEFNLEYVAQHLFSDPVPDYDALEDTDPAAFFQRLQAGTPAAAATAAASTASSGPEALDKDHKMKMSYADISPFFFRGTPEQKQHLFEYNVQDSRLVLRILKKLGALTTILAECKVVGILMKHYLAYGKQMRIMRLLADKAYKDRYFMPTHRKVYSPSGDGTYYLVVPFYGSEAVQATEYEGAAVLEPIRGFHRKFIAVGDMESLYPNIMRSNNLCLSTLVNSRQEAYAKGLVDDDLFEGPSAWLDRRLLFVKAHKGQGLLPKLLETLLTERARIRREMKTVSKELQPVYKAWQEAVKVVANSVYGATGAPTGPIFCVQVASTVTSIGRQTIEGIKHHVETTLHRRVVYGDTDSVMFELLEEDGRTPAEALTTMKTYIDSINGAGLFQLPMRMACECVYSPFLIQSPKIYSAYKYVAGEAPVLQQKGTVSIKRDNCLYVRETYRNLMHRLMIMNQDPDVVFGAMRNRIQALLMGRVPLDKVVMTRKLSKPLDQYEGNGNPHVQVVKQWMQEQPFTAPRVGERVPHVVVRKDPKITTIVARPPYCIRAGGDTVDWEYYFERLQTPLHDVLSAVFVDREAQVTQLFDMETYERDVGLAAPNPITGQVTQRIIRPRMHTAIAPPSAAAKQASLRDFVTTLAAVTRCIETPGQPVATAALSTAAAALSAAAAALPGPAKRQQTLTAYLGRGAS